MKRSTHAEKDASLARMIAHTNPFDVGRLGPVIHAVVQMYSSGPCWTNDPTPRINPNVRVEVH